MSEHDLEPTALADEPYFGVALPEGWEEVDLSTPSIDERLDNDFRNGNWDGVTDEVRRSWELFTRLHVARARQAGAVAMYRYVEAVDGTPPFLVATLVIYVQRLVDRLENMVEQIDTSTKEVTAVDLGDGKQCVRVGRLAHTLIEGMDEQVTMQTYRYYLEIEGTDMVSALSFSTPNVPLAEEFAELFDEIAASYSVTLPAGFVGDVAAADEGL